MKTAKTVIIIVSVCLVAVGIIIMGVSAVVGGLNTVFGKGSVSGSDTYTAKTYTPDSAFSNIDVTSISDDVFLIPSDDGKCRVEYYENKSFSVDVRVEENTLKIGIDDKRQWYEKVTFSFLYIKEHSIKIYLPENEYESLTINSVSADISVPDSFTFESIEYYTTGGDIKSSAAATEILVSKTVSGEAELKNIAAKTLKVSTTSGDIKIKDATADTVSINTTSGDVTLISVGTESDLSIKTVSGEVEMADTVSQDRLAVSTTSGEIEFKDCDAKNISISTISGDVSGVLLSGKDFDVSSLSGNIKVPESIDNGEKCRIDTTSGNTKITISK